MFSLSEELQPLIHLIRKIPVLNILEAIPLQIWISIGLFSFFLFAIWLGKKRHLLCTLEATQQLKRLKRIETPEKQLAHLRGVNPFVFEEIILTALKKRGHRIIRNKRYTGDGGIDGQVYINKKHYLIQAKRYKNHINPAHVQAFAQICKARHAHGLFVHTGKTGKKSAQIASIEKIEMVSGERLLDMLIHSNK